MQTRVVDPKDMLTVCFAVVEVAFVFVETTFPVGRCSIQEIASSLDVTAHDMRDSIAAAAPLMPSAPAMPII